MAWVGGTRRLDHPQEPETLRQLSQRHSARFIGSMELGKSTVREKLRHAQVEVMVVVILDERFGSWAVA